MSLLVPDGARSPIRCIVKGCAEQTGRGKLICSLHAEALRPVPPAVFSHPDYPSETTEETPVPDDHRPAHTALADQAAAAAREALDTFLRTAAENSGSIELVAMSGSRAAMLTRLRERIAEGTTKACAHYRPRSPEPLTWVAWSPDLLRCAPCHRRAAARMTEADQRCHLCDLADGALSLVNVLVPATPVSAPLVTWFGLCAGCREES